MPQPAMAAGHRPCAECRYADYARFKSAWQQVHGAGPWSADAMDLVLHRERREPGRDDAAGSGHRADLG